MKHTDTVTSNDLQSFVHFSLLWNLRLPFYGEWRVPRLQLHVAQWNWPANNRSINMITKEKSYPLNVCLSLCLAHNDSHIVYNIFLWLSPFLITYCDQKGSLKNYHSDHKNRVLLWILTCRPLGDVSEILEKVNNFQAILVIDGWANVVPDLSHNIATLCHS